MEDNTPDSPRDKTGLVIAGLIAACLAIYLQVLWFSFINFDDNLYVYENPFVARGLSGASIDWAFTTFHSANWHPLTWISHMLDVTLFGASAGGHHFVNVIFHAANTILAFVVFRRYTGDFWKSAIVAFLFAVHPAHVESVAWVSERKDVLSTLFWLLSMLAYFRFAASGDDRPLAKRMLSGPYVLTVIAMALGLMAKPMLVTLPFVLLLCDYWPLERLKKRADVVPLILEKVPLFALSAVSAYVTVLAQKSYGAIQSTQVVPIDARVLNAIVSYGKYIAMLFYPANLGVGYAYQYPLPAWQIGASVLILLTVTALCVWQIRERKYLIVGWLWFLGTMVPVIGLVQVGAQSMADRYTYVPYFGLFVIVVWAAAELIPKLKLNFSSTALAAAIPILLLSIAAFNQTSKWKDAKTLYTHSLATGHANFITMHNLCSALVNENRLAEAEPHCRNSIAADPGFADSHILLGVINVRNGKNEDAIANFRQGLAISPNNAMAYGNIAAPLAMTGKPDEAEQSLDRAVELYRKAGANPASLANSYASLAAVYAKQTRYDKAATALQRVLEFSPERADARANYALALYFLNRLAEAKVQIDQSISQNRNQPESYNILGMILMKQGDRSGAIPQFQRAIELKPDYKEAKENLDKANAGN